MPRLTGRIGTFSRTEASRALGAMLLLTMGIAACGGSDQGTPLVLPPEDELASPAISPGPSFFTSDPSVARAAPRWEQVATMTGSGSMETAPFAIATGALQWRLNWRCESGSLGMTTMPPPDKVEAMVDASCPGQGESFSIQTGELRLDVVADGPWDVTVEQQVETPIDEPPLPEMAGAQVLAEAPFYEIDEPVEGTVTLYQLPDGNRALRFEGFETFLNTDLVVRLSEAPAPQNSAEAFEAPYVEIAALKSTMGPQNYLVPPELPTERIRSVVIWCPPVSNAYAAATLVP